MPTNDEIMHHHDPDPDENPWVLGLPGFAPIDVCAYDPRWPERYEALASEIRRALGDTALDIEHIGSTAVPGLAGVEGRAAGLVASGCFAARSDEVRRAALQRARWDAGLLGGVSCGEESVGFESVVSSAEVVEVGGVGGAVGLLH